MTKISPTSNNMKFDWFGEKIFHSHLLIRGQVKRHTRGNRSALNRRPESWGHKFLARLVRKKKAYNFIAPEQINRRISSIIKSRRRLSAGGTHTLERPSLYILTEIRSANLSIFRLRGRVLKVASSLKRGCQGNEIFPADIVCSSLQSSMSSEPFLFIQLQQQEILLYRIMDKTKNLHHHSSVHISHGPSAH